MSLNNLCQYWQKMCIRLLKRPKLSSSTKILIYKLFLRPLLIYNWFESSTSQIKYLEYHALKQIFNKSCKKYLYKKYTDVEVTAYCAILQIECKRVSGFNPNIIRKLLQSCTRNVKTHIYFNRIKW